MVAVAAAVPPPLRLSPLRSRAAAVVAVSPLSSHQSARAPHAHHSTDSETNTTSPTRTNKEDALSHAR